jgi:hypothetical protein
VCGEAEVAVWLPVVGNLFLGLVGGGIVGATLTYLLQRRDRVYCVTSGWTVPEQRIRFLLDAFNKKSISSRGRA